MEDGPPVAAADVLGERLGGAGRAEVSFLIADFSGHALIRLGHAGRARPRARKVRDRRARPADGSPHGRALASQTVELEPGADGTRVFAPVTNRGEAIGVLDSARRAPDEQAVADVALAAHALAYVVIANRRFTDLFEWGQRSVPLSLAAEIQHRLLPGSYTCEAGQFTLAGWLEPAGNVGGDTFDFALERDTLHLSMTDAMGHEVDAAVLATVLVGGCATRAGPASGSASKPAWPTTGSPSARGGFVTGQVARIDLRAGPRRSSTPGIRHRCGCATDASSRVGLEADPPFGTVPGTSTRCSTLPLEPGDRLMFLTDGILERNTKDVDIEAMIAAAPTSTRERRCSTSPR